MTALIIHRSAELSPDGRYRNRLTRWWGDGPRVRWTLLNPSYADANHDDQTVRMLIGFTRRWNYAGFELDNLFAFRTPYPKALADAAAAGIDIVGPDNRVMLMDSPKCLLHVAAWGASVPKGFEQHIADVTETLRARNAVCLGHTRTGAPRHPTRISYETPTIPL